MFSKISQLINFLNINNLKKESNYLSKIIKTSGELGDNASSYSDEKVTMLIEGEYVSDREDLILLLQQAVQRGLHQNPQNWKLKEIVDANESNLNMNLQPVGKEELGIEDNIKANQKLLKSEDETIVNQGLEIARLMLEQGIEIHTILGIRPLDEVFAE